MSKESSEIAAWLVATQAHDIDILRAEKSKLKSEIAELREFAKYCQGFLGCEESRESMALHGITIKAKELLAKSK